MSEELIPGMRIGRYQLLFRLGKGGMGEVWAASSNVTELAFQKLIALKVLRTKEMVSNAAKMFFDEARAASALQHAAIVPTVDLGRDGEVLFIAMDLVRGPSLTALLQRLVINKVAMSPAIVAHVGMQIAHALDYAHERATFEGRAIRLVHRDVSPHNVLLDLNGAVRLTDFGVARTTIQTHESHVGTVRGKPSYMAPEQVVGGDIDARTDLFSLGIVLWESASLKRLFGRSNPVKSMDAVLKHYPKPLTDMVPSFPPAVSDVIARALSKDPTTRYQRASEMADGLAAALRSLPGATTAERDLSQLIESNFPADAFDLEGRVNEAMAAAIAEGLEVPEALDGAVGPGTRSMRTPSGRMVPAPEEAPPRHQTFVGGLGTKVAWPTAHAPDPLAPEAIEEARTQFAAVTPSGIEMLSSNPHSVAAMGSVGSMESLITPYSQTGPSLALPQRRTQMSFVLGALSLAALVLLGTAFIVAKSQSAPDAAATPVGSISVQAESNGVRVTPKPQPNKETAQAPVRPAAPVVPAMPAVEREEQAKREVREAREGRDGREVRDARETGTRRPARRTPSSEDQGAREKSSGNTASDGDATRTQVLELIRQVKKVDPEAAQSMYPTLSEAGEDNVKVLNELRAKARAILSPQKKTEFPN